MTARGGPAPMEVSGQSKALNMSFPVDMAFEEETLVSTGNWEMKSALAEGGGESACRWVHSLTCKLGSGTSKA